MDDREAISYQDMINLVDHEKGNKIIELILTTETPFQALATLASCLAMIVTHCVEESYEADHNINELAQFSKSVAHTIITNRRKMDDTQPNTTVRH